jgi:HAD superfamily hydrolase (TIGR01509 family)
MKRPSVLLFDLGGVLVEIAAFDALKSIVAETLDDDAITERWLRSPAVRSFELGRIPPAAFAAQFIDEWQVRLTPEAFLENFATWVKRPYEGAEALIARLRVEYRVSCLSNCNELHWSQLGGFLNCFDSAFSSHLLGAIKPDEGVFEKVMSELRVEPDQLCFFDDSYLNVQAAKRLGIGAYRVDGIRGVRRILQSEGLL